MTLAELRRWAETMPGVLIPASHLLELLEELDVGPANVERPTSAVDPMSWRERLWSVPAETRLGVHEVAEALGRPKSYVYARTGPKADAPLPHRKLDGSVVITAGELRAWIRDHEHVVAAGPYWSLTREAS